MGDDCSISIRSTISAGGVVVDGASGSGRRLRELALACFAPGLYVIV